MTIAISEEQKLKEVADEILALTPTLENADLRAKLQELSDTIAKGPKYTKQGAVLKVNKLESQLEAVSQVGTAERQEFWLGMLQASKSKSLRGEALITIGDHYIRQETRMARLSIVVTDASVSEETMAAKMLQILQAVDTVCPIKSYLALPAWIQGVDDKRFFFCFPHVDTHQWEQAEDLMEAACELLGLQYWREPEALPPLPTAAEFGPGFESQNNA